MDVFTVLSNPCEYMTREEEEEEAEMSLYSL